MKIENIYYTLMKVGDISTFQETVFLDKDDNFTNDICEAVMAKNRRTALYLKNDYDVEKNHCYESGFEVVPVKITYEW